MGNDITLTEAKKEWQNAIQHDGGHCPCCGRWGKIYARKLNRNMARGVAWLFSRPEEWVNVPSVAPRWLVASNQLPTLRWWGLVERPDEGAREELGEKKHSGHWRVTTKGVMFVKGLIDVPAKVFTYDGSPVGWSAERVYISDCIENFSYREIMNEQAA